MSTATSMILSSGIYSGIEISLLFRHSGYQHGLGNNVRDSATLYFLVRDAADEETAVGAVGSDAASTATTGGVVPALYNGTVPRSNIKTEDRIDETTWVVGVEYSQSAANNQESGGSDTDNAFTFEVTTVDKHITRAISSTKLVSGEDDYGYINDGNGVDVKFPVASFSETHFFSHSAFGSTVRNNIIRCAGKINNASFRGWSTKEVLFLGANGSRNGTKSTDKWQVTFSFAVQPSETVSGLKYYRKGQWNTLSDFVVQGWDYFWTRTKEIDKELTISGDKVLRKEKRVLAAFVSQVYYTASFSSLLGI